ncbi:hypothetical protein SK128_018256 [Halocaridina rubra]|uniref:Aminotransferase class I/classII large domain-containing protein n=1 Tax=Halocaridina rubra TaxID=373956 RepID=A0AAN8WT34_HALRR
MDYTYFLSDTVKRRSPSGVGKFGKLAYMNPKIINFTGGLPNAKTFPFSEMTLTMTDGQILKIDPVMMAECLQYGFPQGYKPLLDQVRALIQRVHNPPRTNDTDVVIIPGSQFGLNKVFEMLVNPNDIVLVPEPCYSGTFSAVLYTNPSGSNPDGIVWSDARRRRVYDLACKYDFLILEDDPYYFLQFEEEFPPSFLQLDRDGRVIRIETFSKVIGAGLRIGYAIGPIPLIEVLTVQVQGVVNHVSNVSQACVSEMLRTVGIGGFLEKVKKTQKFYKAQRDTLMKAAEKYLTGLCEWTIPAGGFYLWLKRHIFGIFHKVLSLPNTSDMILKRGIKRGFLAIPGCAYNVRETPSSYLRLSYAMGNEKYMEEVSLAGKEDRNLGA